MRGLCGPCTAIRSRAGRAARSLGAMRRNRLARRRSEDGSREKAIPRQPRAAILRQTRFLPKTRAGKTFSQSNAVPRRQDRLTRAADRRVTLSAASSAAVLIAAVAAAETAVAEAHVQAAAAAAARIQAAAAAVAASTAAVLRAAEVRIAVAVAAVLRVAADPTAEEEGAEVCIAVAAAAATTKALLSFTGATRKRSGTETRLANRPLRCVHPPPVEAFLFQRA